jgi:hypothetical protein
MRFLASILSLFVLAATLFCALIAAAPAQENPTINLRQETLREWHELAKGRAEFDVSDPASLPKLLVTAVEQSNCNYKQDMKTAPVRFIRFQYRRFAIVTCWGFVARDQLYELSDLKNPKLMEFPVFAAEGGFTTSSGPGSLTWKKEAGILEAESSTDMMCTGRGRHTYRLSRMQSGLVLTRVEVNKDDCGKNEWTTLWEAPAWNELTRPTGP